MSVHSDSERLGLRGQSKDKLTQSIYVDSMRQKNKFSQIH
jgi:hypothetical protein